MVDPESPCRGPVAAPCSQSPRCVIVIGEGQEEQGVDGDDAERTTGQLVYDTLPEVYRVLAVLALDERVPVIELHVVWSDGRTR